MKDISNVLEELMHEKDCTPLTALFFLIDEKDNKDGISILQPQPSK